MIIDSRKAKSWRYVAIRQLTKRFDAATVFDGIDLDIDRGEMCVLVGPSGCGKTTLLRAMAGLTTPDRGTIAIDGVDVTGLSARDRGIGMVLQHYALFPNMTVEQNLAFGLERTGFRSDEIRRRVAAMTALMGLEEEERVKALPRRPIRRTETARGAGARPSAGAEAAVAR